MSRGNRVPVELRTLPLRALLETARQLDRASAWLVRRVRDRASSDEASALTAWRYVRIGDFAERWHREAGLFDFEAAALARFFPPPPAHLLVHGAGGGRETHALLSRGYRVTAAEPVAGLVVAARAAFGARATLVQAGLDADPGAVPELAGPFDGVIIGWSAYGHVLERERRVRALAAARAACPKGPILISWREAPGPGLRGRAQTVREVAAHGSTLPPRALSHFGLFHAVLDETAVRAEAEAAGSALAYYGTHADSGYPNAVLVPH